MVSSTKQRTSNKPLIYVSELPGANSRLQAKQRPRASLETVQAIHFALNLTSLLFSEKQKQKMLLTHQFFFTIRLWLTSVKLTEDYGDNDLLL